MRRVLPSSWSSSVIALLVLITTSAHAVEFPGPDPGPATATRVGEAYVGLANHAIRATWSASGGRLVPATLRDELSGTDLEPARELFVLEFQDGTRLAASRMHANPCTIEDVAPDTGAVIAADRIAGKRLRAVLVSSDGALRVRWSATLRDGASYVRQEIAIEPVTRDADVARIVMVDHWLTGGDVVGRVSGSPIVAGSLFTGLEHPMATSQVEDGGTPRLVPAPGSDDGPLAPDAPTAQTVTPTARWGRAHVRSWLELSLPLPRGRSFVLSSVTGTAPPGQMRRAFLCYVERERAHPYRTFLHYNSWYDIGYFTRYDEHDCLNAIHAFGDSLVRARGVHLDSFLFDDGWDDTARGGQWRFHAGFPNGFARVRAAAESLGAGPGMWLSPWGGYGKPRIERRRSAQAAGFETVRDPWAKDPEYGQLLALSGPRYYESFHRATLDLVQHQGVNQFKIDGTGSINSVMPGSRFGSDFEAAITILHDLRAVRPDLFINLTTGTWPSPFWLRICDTIWRGGDDHDFAGVGSARERWITYRDADTHERVVQAGPLYPVNSLMLHGIIAARHAHDLDHDTGAAFQHEVRSYFGSGTQLQEMYVSHGLLTTADWDVLAASARWSRANAATLVDTHWVGGDPRRLEVYGWAAWSPTKGVLTLRNPSNEPQEYTLDLAHLLELPAGAPDLWTVSGAFEQRPQPALEGVRNAWRPVTVTLKPFEVVVYEAIPAMRATENR